MNKPITQPVAEGATAELIQLTNGLFNAASLPTYVDTLTNTLYYWLTSEDLNLDNQIVRNQLSMQLELIRFVVKLDAIADRLPDPVNQEGGQVHE